MSKMNNNSRKSSKNTSSKSSKAKKSSKKNFKIENLEPRLMMDAASGFEVEKLDAYAEQFVSVSESLGKNISEVIDSVSDFNASSLGITEGVNTFSSLLEDSVGEFQEKIVNNVKKILADAIDRAQTEIEKINQSIEDEVNKVEEKLDQAEKELDEKVDEVREKITSISLSDFVSNYVNKVLEEADQKEYGYLSFSAEGSKLIITLNLQHNTSLSDIGFDFGMIA